MKYQNKNENYLRKIINGMAIPKKERKKIENNT